MSKKTSVIFLFIGFIAGTITFDSVRKDFFRKPTISAVQVEGSFNPRENSEITEPTTPFREQGTEITPVLSGAENIGSSELSISDFSISEGSLVLIDSQHSAGTYSADGMISLKDYQNNFYSVIGRGIRLKQESAEALNSMMYDYYNATQLQNFAVYGTTDTYFGEDSPCPKYFQESISGYCIDLAVMYNNQLVQYDGNDTEKWIIENCYKYGFIVRYPYDKTDITGEEYCPWHLRYVGTVHSTAMHNKNLCLEEYIESIKDFNYEQPMLLSIEEKIYRVYYIKADDINSARVPIHGNYDISGNNIDGYIITLYD